MNKTLTKKLLFPYKNNVKLNFFSAMTLFLYSMLLFFISKKKRKKLFVQNLPWNKIEKKKIYSRRDGANSRLPRSSSIDSMVEAVWNDASPSPSPRPSLCVPQTSSNLLQPDYGVSQPPSRRESLLSPSAGRRSKQNRGMTGKWMCHLLLFKFKYKIKEIVYWCGKNWKNWKKKKRKKNHILSEKFIHKVILCILILL